MTMFGGLLDSRPAKSRKGARRFSTSGGSLILHAAILLSVVIGSYLHIEPLADPGINVHFREFILPAPPAPPPPPPPPAGASLPKEEAVEKPEIVPQEPPDVVQPPEIPKEMPESDESAGSVESDGGVEGGLDGGVPGGVPDGVVGGTPDGVKGGILDGIPDVPPGPSDLDQPIYLIGDVRPPERTTFVRPQYPENARKVRVEGMVILEIVVGRTGEVEDVKVLRSDPLFDVAAVEAVRKWKYQPALQGGRPVKVYLTVKVDFKLR